MVSLGSTMEPQVSSVIALLIYLELFKYKDFMRRQ